MRTLPLSWIVLETVLTLFAASGCALGGRQFPSAKWALDDPLYAQQHSSPASPDPVEQRVQQAWDMSDARFQQGKSGEYLSGGSTIAGHFPAAIGSTGVVHLPTPWSTIRYGVMGMDNGGLGAGGVEAGVRLHAPTRFTPYVGLSTDLGISNIHTKPVQYNNGTRRSAISKASGVAAIVPEAGVSYWLTSSTRLNAGASYFVAVNQPDFLVLGLSMEFLSGGNWGSDNMAYVPRHFDSEGNNRPFDASTTPYFVESVELVNSVEQPMTPTGTYVVAPAQFVSP